MVSTGVVTHWPEIGGSQREEVSKNILLCACGIKAFLMFSFCASFCLLKFLAARFAPTSFGHSECAVELPAIFLGRLELRVPYRFAA